MATKRRPKMTEIDALDAIPQFQGESEEADFWSAHGLGGPLLAQMGPIDEDALPPALPRTRSIAVRLDPDISRRIKAVAAKKHKGYQALLKEFVIERLYEEEKREGLIDSSSTRGA